jgi:hypothetical protein
MGTLDELRQRARSAGERLQGRFGSPELLSARNLLDELRDSSEFEGLGLVAEALSRVDPSDPKTRRLYAQSLIETGKACLAVDVLQVLLNRVSKEHPEAEEAAGLLGRAYKQIFFDSVDRTSPMAQTALQEAIATYRRPYEVDPRNTWHGVNLLALISSARTLGLPAPADLDARQLATQLRTTLEHVPEEQRDGWYLPTLAEVTLGLDDWDEVERALRRYADSPQTTAFHLQSTLRQFSKVWNVQERDSRGRGLVDILRARLLQLRGGGLDLSATELQSASMAPAPDRSQLEAVLGDDGPKTYKWWQLGMQRALSVASIRHNVSGRVGTGFLVRARDLGREPGDELLVLTNFHVVNPEGIEPGIQPADVEVIFEAADANRVYTVAELLCSSPIAECDASLLRLAQPIAAIEPLPFARALPTVDPDARVYVIGHPGGRDLSFSFQDNELLDHEGPPNGKQQIPGVCRVHYRAPTEGGSSGSPVFNNDSWQVIALHHKGGKLGMPKLNGFAGTYPANEGIALTSVREKLSGR